MNGVANDHVLIFDPYTAGHHLEHLSHLVRYEVSRETGRRLSLVVHPDIDERCPDLVADSRASENVDVHSLQSEEWEQIRGSSNLLGQSVAEWNLVRTYGHDLQVDRCILMEMNVLQFALGLPLQPVDFDVDGILFFPYVRIDCEDQSPLKRWLCWLEKLRKWGQTEWMLRNTCLQTIYVLNDSEAAATLREIHTTDVFTPLPDPVPEWEKSDNARDGQMEAAGEWSEDRTHFLLFGSLRTQKGIRQLLQAAEQLAPSDASRMGLHLLGQPKNEWETQLPRRIERLRRVRPGLHLHYEGRFLSNVELAQAIEATDIILAPYQRTEGSSGVIGHAARHRCPVIGPSTGLVGSLIQEYQLGITINATSPSAIRRAMINLVGEQKIGDEEKMMEYVRERTPDAFASALLDELP
ncbi:glycosyltransferase [Salinibacter ruber]|uniref:glycosyltransferase n=1 Tax=Salinibacter ruber TaxID=146919 RepID=UPI002167F820|nr:glycosyltransferase [Salinibacter ruber]